MINNVEYNNKLREFNSMDGSLNLVLWLDVYVKIINNYDKLVDNIMVMPVNSKEFYRMIVI